MTSRIDTLGEASRHGMVVRITCPTCRREARFMAKDLAAFYGHHRTPESLPFKCEQCDSYEVTTIFEEWLTKEAKEQVVWKPTKFRG